MGRVISISLVLAAGLSSLMTADYAAAQSAGSINDLIGTADPVAGQKVSHACMACHSFDKGGSTRIGPNLWDIVNRPVGQVPKFNYSSAMRAIKIKTWTYDNLNTWLYNPAAEAPGTLMSFPGIKKEQDRADLIAWLRIQSDKPAPLPTTK